jgi:AcrR family transcriptional regulator
VTETQTPMPDRPAKSRKGEQTRAEIIACAKDLFYQRGYAATSFSDIVDAAGVYRGNIYHYFKTKDEILEAVVAQRLQEFGALQEAWEQDCTGPRERLMRFVEMIAQNENDLVRFGCPIGTLNTELGKRRRDLQRSAKALFDLFRDWLMTQFVALGRGTEAESLALHLLARAQGISLIAHVYQDTALLEREVATLREWLDGL